MSQTKAKTIEQRSPLQKAVSGVAAKNAVLKGPKLGSAPRRKLPKGYVPDDAEWVNSIIVSSAQSFVKKT